MRPSAENDTPELKPPAPAAGALQRWLGARTRKALSLNLSPLCDVVYMAETDAEALRALETTRFDLVFMDVHMREMGGVEAVCALRDREPAGWRTPVVAIAAGLSDGDREACLLAGMDGFAGTPVETRALLALVKRVIAQAQPRAQAA